MRKIVRHVGGQRDLGERFRPVSTGDGELAVLELDVGLGGFEQMGGDLAALGDDLVYRLEDRGAYDCLWAGSVGGHTVRDLGGVADNYLSVIGSSVSAFILANLIGLV